VEALNREWKACLPTDVAAGLGPPEWANPDAAVDLAMRTAPDGDVAVIGEALGAEIDKLPQEQRTLLGSEAEAQVALADFDCRAATDYVARYTEAQRRLEERFVADHKSDLDALQAAAEGL
jgi:hypothetical protein